MYAYLTASLYTRYHSLKANRLFAHYHSQKPVRFPAEQKECVHHATPSFYPSAVAAGITHYTFVPKVVCQREALPPFGYPNGFIGMWPHFAFLLVRPILKTRKKRRNICPSIWQIFLLFLLSAVHSRRIDFIPIKSMQNILIMD